MHPPLASALAFPACVTATVGLALLHPALFSNYFGLDLRQLIVPCIQVIMFGMGATLGLDDFARVARMPGAILCGFVLQYTVMPLLALLLTHVFPLEAEIAAGVILVGCVAGGVASNVITYLAGGNVPLSVTMTLCSTLASPFATPLLMKWLAGRLVPVDVASMMLSIANMILLPIAVGLAAHGLLFSQAAWNRRPHSLWAIAGVCVWIGAWLARDRSLSASLPGEIRIGLVLGGVFLAIVAVGKWLFSVRLGWSNEWFNRMLPVLSMAGICLVIGIITSRARDHLLHAGPALLAAAILHNLGGYTLGYWLARALRFNELDCRTVAIEVGMQNAGMATGIAMSVLQSAKAGLASVVFGPWMNLSGALLAGWWKRSLARTPVSSDAQSPCSPGSDQT
jgi:BASS family bile acid:Na+ symporter